MLSGEGEILCRNCNQKLTGEYCASCGQKKFARRDFTLRGFIKDLAEEVVDYDSKIFVTIKTLIGKPGKLTNDFLNGKQKSYIAPVKLYLIIITINFIVYSALDNYSPINLEYLLGIKRLDWFDALMHRKISESGLSVSDFYHEMNLRVNNVFPLFLYLLIFIYPFILKLYFYRSDKYYIEHLIFCMHFMSFGFLRDTLFLPVQIYSQDVAFYLSFATTIVYLYYALKNVYGSKGASKFINPLVLYTFFLILFSLAIAVSFTYSMIFFNYN